MMEVILEVVSIKQVIRKTRRKREVLRSPSDASTLVSKLIGDEDREVFLSVMLNTKNEVVAVHRCHVGSLNSSIVHPREVFKSAILSNSASIIVAHNHPSQNVQPSREDILVTQRLVEAGELIGIEVLDHLIVNEMGEFYSMKEHDRLR